ncbi:MAG: hypothetical protein AAF688_12255 [Bacteroidota bacterium]
MNKSIFLVIALALNLIGFSQEDQDIDPSKPTNLYTQINTLAEYNSTQNFNTIGTRFNFQYAINADNLVLAEVPYFTMTYPKPTDSQILG